MKRLLFVFIMTSGLMITSAAFALPPVVNYNVEVMQNATPAQCNDWRGQIGPEENTTASIDSTEDGLQSMGGPGIRTCTGCAVNQSGTCVCKTCYDYTDGM